MVPHGTAFQQDVFLLGVCCWQILVGGDVPRSAGVASPGAAATLLPPAVDRWLRRALEADPTLRFVDAEEMANAFDVAVGRRAAAGLADELRRHRSDLIPFSTWPVTSMRASARATSWVSGPGDEAVLVKLWLGFPQGPGHHARALAFLETAARIKADRAAWTPEVLGAGWGEAGMFLATKFLPGVELGNFMATGRPEAMLQVVASLVRAVAAMHARNLAHGDLKPSNVLVVQVEASARAMLVDVPDLPPDGADTLSTPAYAPSGGKAGRGNETSTLSAK